jgi:hypothetical protein
VDRRTVKIWEKCFVGISYGFCLKFSAVGFFIRRRSGEICKCLVVGFLRFFGRIYK